MSTASRVIAVILIGLVGVFQGRAQPAPSRVQIAVGIPSSHGTVTKWESRRLLVWALNCPEQPAAAIELFEPGGTRLAAWNPLRDAPEAAQAGIWDVSAGDSGMVAVSAVFVRADGRRTASLLLYNPGGVLRKAFALPSGRGLLRVKVDGDDNVWGLGAHSGDQDPATMPMLTRYDARSGQWTDLLNRSAFPAEAQDIEEGLDSGGRVSLGLRGEEVWFWFPKSRQLTVFHSTGGYSKTYTTGLPQPAGDATGSAMDGPPAELARCFWLGARGLVAQVMFRGSHHFASGVYRWTPGSSRWERLRHPEWDSERVRLIGVDDQDLVLRSPGPGATFELSRVTVRE